ncbi:MAG: multiple sugar transport system permease protein, partial [Acetobacteraceae bacterium]|nr:multiple sugar transport system permease protein [Acetobacteraceae bacterium]
MTAAIASTADPPVAIRPREHGGQRMRRAARRRRFLTKAAATLLSIVILIWTITPIYNMVMVALEAEGDVFSEHIWPPQPSPRSFWIVVTQGYWYLEYFWHQ